MFFEFIFLRAVALDVSIEYTCFNFRLKFFHRIHQYNNTGVFNKIWN